MYLSENEYYLLIKYISMKKQIIFILIIPLFLCTCTTKQNKEVTEEEMIASLPILDIAGNLSTSISDTFTWNSIAKSVQLIPLNSKKLLGRAPSIRYISDDLIVISEAQEQTVNIYDMKGGLKSSFQHVGKGPGEYVYLSYVQFNYSDSSVIVFDINGKLLKYSLAGKCLEEKSMKDRQWTNIMHIDANNKIYTKNGPDTKSLVSVLNQDYTIEQQFFMFDTTATERRKACISLNIARSNTADKYLINRSFDDTLYIINNSILNPICILNKGPYILSEEESENFMKLPSDNNFITYTSLDMFSSFVLYRYYWHGDFSLQLWNWEKEEIIGKAELNKPNQYSGLVGGFNYVFHSGKKTRIIPNYVTDSCLGFLIPAEDCVGEIKGVKEDDNPVLMMIKLK